MNIIKNNGTDQTAEVCRLICVTVVRMQQKNSETVFPAKKVQFNNVRVNVECTHNTERKQYALDILFTSTSA